MVIFMVHTCVQREVLPSDITFKIFFFTAASAADSYLELLIFFINGKYIDEIFLYHSTL